MLILLISENEMVCRPSLNTDIDIDIEIGSATMSFEALWNQRKFCIFFHKQK